MTFSNRQGSEWSKDGLLLHDPKPDHPVYQTTTIIIIIIIIIIICFSHQR